MADLTPAELASLRRLLEAATPGPWRKTNNNMGHVVSEHADMQCRVAQCGDYADDELRRRSGKRWNADAALIAALVNAAPRLLAMAERLLTEHAEMKHEH